MLSLGFRDRDPKAKKEFRVLGLGVYSQGVCFWNMFCFFDDHVTLNLNSISSRSLSWLMGCLTYNGLGFKLWALGLIIPVCGVHRTSVTEASGGKGSTGIVAGFRQLS